VNVAHGDGEISLQLPASSLPLPASSFQLPAFCCLP
jgi:hypothetical protein